jgi:hypothetical protein
MNTFMRVLVVSLLCISSARAGNLIVNGNFDTGLAAGTCVYGTTTVSGWKILAGNVDIGAAGCYGLDYGADPYGPNAITPVIGGHFASLTGSNGGNNVAVLYQDVPTKVGTVYQLTFYFGGNFEWIYNDCTADCLPNDGPLKAMQLYVNSVLIQTYTMNTADGVAAPQWVLGTYTFVATSTTTVISFHSLNGTGSVADPNGMPAQPSDFGPLLVGVSLFAL